MSTVVVKIGGALIDKDGALASVWRGVKALQADHAVVVVHGGGPQATGISRRLGHEPQIVAGRRVTTDLGLDTILWTVRGALNARLVASARPAGIRAVGLSGVDGQLVTVVKRLPSSVDGETLDWRATVEAVFAGLALVVAIPALLSGARFTGHRVADPALFALVIALAIWPHPVTPFAALALLIAGRAIGRARGEALA